MSISVFDFDGTLLKGDSLLIAARQSNKEILFLWYLLRIVPYYFKYKLNLLSTKKFKEKFIEIFNLCSIDQSTKIKEKVKTQIISRIEPKALDRLYWHKKKGDRVIICSASPNFILEPIADYLKVELVCTEFMKKNGILIPKIKGENCKGVEKVLKLEKFLNNKLSDLDIEAYGDSAGDQQLLEISKKPHYRDFTSKISAYPKFPFKTLLNVLLISIIFYIYIFFSSKENLISTLIEIKLEVLIGLSIVLLGYFLRYIRWRILIKKLNIKSPLKTDLRIWMSSYAFTATPGKAGEAIRSLLLNKELNISYPLSITALFFERFTDGIAVFVILLFNAKSISYSHLPFKVEYLLSIFLFIVLIAFYKKRYLFNLLEKILNLFPKTVFNSITKNKENLKKLFDSKILLISIFLATISWSLEGYSLSLILNKISAKNFSFGISLISHTLSGFLGAISMIPGGIGSSEISNITLLSINGVSTANAVLATLIIRLMTLWFATFLGVLCLYWGYYKK